MRTSKSNKEWEEEDSDLVLARMIVAALKVNCAKIGILLSSSNLVLLAKKRKKRVLHF